MDGNWPSGVWRNCAWKRSIQNACHSCVCKSWIKITWKIFMPKSGIITATISIPCWTPTSMPSAVSHQHLAHQNYWTALSALVRTASQIRTAWYMKMMLLEANQSTLHSQITPSHPHRGQPSDAEHSRVTNCWVHQWLCEQKKWRNRLHANYAMICSCHLMLLLIISSPSWRSTSRMHCKEPAMLWPCSVQTLKATFKWSPFLAFHWSSPEQQ